MDKLQTPPIRTPLAEGDSPAAAGKTAKEWYLHWKQTSDLVNDHTNDITGLEDTAVRGQAALSAVNQIPKVVAPGELGGSSISDDGATVEVSADVDVSGVYRVGGTQVVGARAAGLTASGLAVAAPPAAYNPAYETTVQTLVNNLKTRVDELELRLKAHGLIA